MLESGVVNFYYFTILVFSHFVLVQVRIVQVRINKFEITEKVTFIKKLKFSNRQKFSNSPNSYENLCAKNHYAKI